MINIKDWEYELKPMAPMIKQEKKWLLEHAQTKLWKSDFWKPVFYKVLNRHGLQKEFYLLGAEPTPDFVDKYLHSTLKKLQGRYEVACRRCSGKNGIELSLGLSYVSSRTRKRQMTTVSELSVYIDDTQITVSMLPYSEMVGKYYLDEYIIVENVLNDLCAELFSSLAKQISDFQNYRKKLQSDEKRLNLRTIEIARASIKSLYKKSSDEDDIVLEGYLFTILRISGKEECILYRNFLDNPQMFISKLQKSEKNISNIIK